ncbi:MAG TPA: major tail protein [Negativicutes bacterium]|nr:major tail protein [Negativicutes bacterium]
MPENKVTFGLENVHIAFTAGVSAWEAPIAIPGAVSWTPTAQGQTSTFRADNSPYFIITSNNGYTGELEMALIPDAILARMLGWEIDSNGMLVEITNGTPDKFALMGQIEGDQKNRRFVYYDCQAQRPAKQHKTTGETIEPDTDVLAMTVSPIEIAGKKVVKGDLELSDTNAAVYNSWYDAVVIPNAVPAAVVKTQLAAAIALAGTLVQAEYTTGSWTALQNALTAATTANTNVSATQAQVNAAETALEAAILALVAVP